MDLLVLPTSQVDTETPRYLGSVMVDLNITANPVALYRAEEGQKKLDDAALTIWSKVSIHKRFSSVWTNDSLRKLFAEIWLRQTNFPARNCPLTS